MLILKVISRLLDYPSAALFNAAEEIKCVINESTEISSATKTALLKFVTELTERDLYDAEESYDLLFDRGRALSLLLFEHVHGESRDRGQAMVDLMNVYQSKGFEVDAAQLPDYIPLYLEFLSEQDSEFAKEWLADVGHLLTMLAERLKGRECHYSILFDALIEVAEIEVDREEIRAAVGQEQRDDTPEVIDREWEDKEVKFDDPMAGQCPSSVLQSSRKSLDPNTIQQVPIKWRTDFINGHKNAAEVAGL